MRRMLIIDNCDDCPHFDNEYYMYEELCTLLNERNEKGSTTILPNCPLCPVMELEK